MTTAISTAAVNNNNQRQPGFDSVPDLIRYYVGGADDNAVLSYGGGNDGVVNGSMTFSRTAQTEVRIRYPCNRRRPLITDYPFSEAAFPNILPSTIENSRLLRQRCRTLTATSASTEGLRVLSTFPGEEIEASTSSQNTNHRHHSPSPPPQTSKCMRVQSSSRSSVRRIPSATVTSGMLTSATSLKPSSAAGSANQSQSQPLTFSSYPPRIDSQSSITEFTSVSPNSSIKTLPRQSKLSYPLPSTSGSSLSLSSERPSTSGSKSNLSLRPTPSYPDMPSRNTPLTISDLLSSPSSSMNPPRLSRSISRTNSLNREVDESFGFYRVNVEGVRPNLYPPRSPSSVRDMYNKRTDDKFFPFFDVTVLSSFDQQRSVPNGYRFNPGPDPIFDSLNMPSEDSKLAAMDLIGSRSLSPQIRPSELQVPDNSQNTLSSSENLNDEVEKKEEHNRGQLITDRQKEERALEQPQQNEHHFADRKVLNSQRRIQDEEAQEDENPMKNFELRQKSVEKDKVLKNTINDTKVDQKEKDEQSSSDLDLNVEKSLKASENQNFQKCRTRWSNTMRQGLVDMLEQPHLDQLDRQLTQSLEIRDCDLRQRRLRQTHQTLIKEQEVDHTTESIKKELHKIIPDTETRQLAKLTNRIGRAATVAPAQIRATLHIRSSSNDLTENMIRQWAGLQRISNLGRNSNVTEVYHGSQIPLIELLPRIRRKRRQNTRQMNTNCRQVNREITGHDFINQEGDKTPVTKAGQSNTTTISSDIYCPFTRIIPSTTIESSTSTSGQEIGSVGVGSIGCKPTCDYVNINSQIDNHHNSFDKNGTRNFNSNNLDKIHNKSYQHHEYKHQVNKQQSNNNYNSFFDNIEPIADYENMLSHNIDDINDSNYENLSQNNDEKRQQLMNDCYGSNTTVAAALRAVHLAIIGDPDDSAGTTVGTGKLAAALCRADGRTTVLPYRRNVTESKQVVPLLSTCPLQLLCQPGPAGRRARLDVIERYNIFKSLFFF